MLDFMLHSVPKTRQVDESTGAVHYEADPRYLVYRMMDIDADNVAAFVKMLHGCADLVNSLKGHLPSRLWAQLKRDVDAEIETNVIALTATSGQHAHLMSMLLRDATESYHYLSTGANKKEGLAAKLRGMQGGPPPDERQGGGQGGPPPGRGGPPPGRGD